MAANYLPYEPGQMLLLPGAIQDWLPEGHLAHFMSDTVDALDLKAFYARYEGGGSRNQPFHPAMMVEVLVYAYATGALEEPPEELEDAWWFLLDVAQAARLDDLLAGPTDGEEPRAALRECFEAFRRALEHLDG